MKTTITIRRKGNDIKVENSFGQCWYFSTKGMDTTVKTAIATCAQMMITATIASQLDYHDNLEFSLEVTKPQE